MCLGDRWEDLTSLQKKWSQTHEAAPFWKPLLQESQSSHASLHTISSHFCLSLSVFLSFPPWVLSPALCSGLCGDVMCDCVHVLCCTVSVVHLCVQILVCVCDHREVDSSLRWCITLSYCGSYGYSSHDFTVRECMYVCVFCRNVGGRFRASFHFLPQEKKKHSH